MKRKRVSSHQPGMAIRGFMLTMGILAAVFHVFLFRSLADEFVAAISIMSVLLTVDAFVLWWAMIFMTQSCVTLFEEGIELERGGSKIFTTWDNVSHFGVKGLGKNRRRGIYLHEKVTPETTGIVEKLVFGQGTDFIPIGQLVNLPTESLFSNKIDTAKLLETEFGQDLYSVAPQLFDGYSDYKPKNRLQENDTDDIRAQYLDELSSQREIKQ